MRNALFFLQFSYGVSAVLRHYHVTQPVTAPGGSQDGGASGWWTATDGPSSEKEQPQVPGHHHRLPAAAVLRQSGEQGHSTTSLGDLQSARIEDSLLLICVISSLFTVDHSGKWWARRFGVHYEKLQLWEAPVDQQQSPEGAFCLSKQQAGYRWRWWVNVCVITLCFTFMNGFILFFHSQVLFSWVFLYNFSIISKLISFSFCLGSLFEDVGGFVHIFSHFWWMNLHDFYSHSWLIIILY